MLLKQSALISLCALFLTGGSASAYAFLEKNELASSFCAAMADENIYESKDLDNYARLIPGKDSWVFRTSNDFRPDWTVKPETMNYLKNMQSAFRAQNAELVIVIPPIRGMVHADALFAKDRAAQNLKDSGQAWKQYEQSLAAMRQNGINVVGIPRSEIIEDFYYPRNHHWTSAGARLTAQKVAETVKALPTYARLPKTEYVTMTKGTMVVKSPFDKAFTAICNTEIPADTAQLFETVPQATASGGSALFGDNAGAQVVLLGTSNSVADSSWANFEGFLKEFMSVDVLNNAAVGGGIDNSIIAYLNSAHFRNGQPKVVIWEIPGYYDLNNMDDKIFNQVIPAAYGQCDTNAIYKTTMAPLKKGGNKLLEARRVGENAAMTKLAKSLPQNGDLYLHIDFAKPMKEKFSVEFDYGTNGMEKQLFDRDEQYDQKDGAFYTQFPVRPDKKLQGIKIIVSEKMTGMTPSLEICQLPKPAGTDKGKDL